MLGDIAPRLDLGTCSVCPAVPAPGFPLSVELWAQRDAF